MALNDKLLNIPFGTDLATQTELNAAVEDLERQIADIEVTDVDAVKKSELKETIESGLSGYNGFANDISSVPDLESMLNWTKAIHDTLMNLAHLSSDPVIDTEMLTLDPGKTYLITNTGVAAVSIYAEPSDIENNITMTAYDRA